MEENMGPHGASCGRGWAAAPEGRGGSSDKGRNAFIISRVSIGTMIIEIASTHSRPAPVKYR
jgi:hypothetical protein